MPEKVLQQLSRSLDWEVRRHVRRACEALWREISYGTEQGKPGYRKALSVGWTEERLRIVAVLNAFNRVALGPYAAAFMRTAGVDLGLSRDVLHGSRVRVNSATGEPVRLALKEFERLSVSVGINLRWLHMTRMSEVIYAINKQTDDLE